MLDRAMFYNWAQQYGPPEILDEEAQQMNLNEQLQQAYSAGYYRALNEARGIGEWGGPGGAPQLRDEHGNPLYYYGGGRWGTTRIGPDGKPGMNYYKGINYAGGNYAGGAGGAIGQGIA